MPSNPLGTGVSRFLNDRDRQFAGVVFQASKPPLDSEFNLMGSIELEARAEEVRSRLCSGWLSDESNPYMDYVTSPVYSNYFYFGTNTNGARRNTPYAVVNGWVIPVSGTRTGVPPLAANDADCRNRILLNPPSSGVAGNVPELVFLEAWLARIDVDPPPPGVAVGKPSRGFLYKFGNVESGYTYLPDEMVDPDINFETTKRVQIQYRIRVVRNVNLSDYPEGFDPTCVYAQGLLSSPSVIPFSSMRQELGDPGLWRAGTGDSSTFSTVDGYVYAIPICTVFRRNATAFSDLANLAGAFNRNNQAVTRADYATYSSGLVLPGSITDVATSATFPSISNTILSTLTSYGEAYFKIDEEVLLVTSVTPSGSAFLVTFNRGQLRTTARSHAAGKPMEAYSLRPDGLFADQISASDILDMRHSVADKFDYDSILKTNLVSLLKGDLRTTWKRNGASTSQGSTVLYGDRVTSTSSVGSLTKLDSPDGNRRLWSDAVTTQRFVVPVKVPTNGSVQGNSINIAVDPYNINVTIESYGSGRDVNRQIGGQTLWFYGDSFRLKLSNFQAGVSGTEANQIRFALPVDSDVATLARFDGMTTDPNGVTNSLAPTGTSPSATLIRYGTPILFADPILKDGNGLSVAYDAGTGDLIYTLTGGTSGDPYRPFIDALQGSTSDAYSQALLLYLEFTVIYGAGRGLSHKPKYVNRAVYQGTVASILSRPGLDNAYPMVPTYLSDSPMVQVGVDREYAVTSEVMVDPGSKSFYVAPYRRVNTPSTLVRDGSRLNWYYNPALHYQGGMPRLVQDGTSTINSTVDPLNLFHTGLDTRFVEVPQEYLIRPGLHHIPTVPASVANFSSGMNFLLSSKEGTVTNTSDYNPDLVRYPSLRPGYYIVTADVGEVYGTATSGNTGAYGEKVTFTRVQSKGGMFKGIKFPPFYMPARITGVYLRQFGSLVPVQSPFSNNRVFVNSAGSDTNLIKDSFEGPSVFLYSDQNGDPYFVLNYEVLDPAKMPVGTTFENAQFLVECTLFAMDRGWGTTNSRFMLSSASGTSSLNAYTSANIGFITPAPLVNSSTDNQVTLYYNRVPYQGDVFGTQSSYADDVYHQGPPTIGENTGVFNNQLGPVSTLSLSNPEGFEILSAHSFVTSSGTGRLSGSGPTPLLTKAQAPENALDYDGTRIDLYRKSSLNRVGYEDWASNFFPTTSASISSQPVTKLEALSELFDGDINSEFCGATTNLPLGAYFRDKDFIGKTLYQSRSSSNVATIPVGTTTFVPFSAAISRGNCLTSDWEGLAFVCGSSTTASGSGTEALITVDGTSNVNSTTAFKTCRGGAAYCASDPFPGGPISVRITKARGNSNSGAVLMGTAYLVRSAPFSIGGLEVHAGNELQMVVVTHAIPNYFRESEVYHSASGIGEGYTAVDRYRILGKPLERKNVAIDVSLTPSPEPLFNTRIYDDPIFYGSADINTTAQESETLSVIADGQTSFTLSYRPLSSTAVQLFLNGIKLENGVSYSLSGSSYQNLTYTGSVSLMMSDVLEAWYLKL